MKIQWQAFPDQTICQFMTILPNSTFYRIMRGFHRTFATGVACSQGTLTPPDTCFHPLFKGYCMYSDCLDQFSRIYIEFMIYTELRDFMEHLRRAWLANMERLLLRTPSPVPLGTCICSTCWDKSFSRTCRYFSGQCSSNISRYFLDFAWRTCHKY